MNYIWKWNSIPKYFAYEQVISVQAQEDGVLSKVDGNYFILTQDNKKVKLNITPDAASPW